ncbi:MAG TPA: YSC84-related protein [Burkholderiaceae bacterium]|nr:YSC84-related protein [Burkholderiaceae bacterium]
MTLNRPLSWLAALLLALALTPARADDYSDTIHAFRGAGQSGAFFANAYGYAVFPVVGKGGVVVGVAHGDGRVYEKGRHVGDASMTQVTVGAQLGGQAYSEIIFLENKRAFDEFTRGEFEFGAEVSAVAVTAGASAQAGTGGIGAAKNVGTDKADAVSRYHDGIAVFTLVKGGLMYEATVGGQKFSYTKK